MVHLWQKSYHFKYNSSTIIIVNIFIVLIFKSHSVKMLFMTDLYPGVVSLGLKININIYIQFSSIQIEYIGFALMDEIQL